MWLIIAGVVSVFLMILSLLIMKNAIEVDKWAGCFFCYVITTILMIAFFAWLYGKFGIIHNSKPPIDDFGIETIYFSIVTWTTLGCGDFAPSEKARLLAAIEALVGYIHLGILVSAIFHFLGSKKTKSIKTCPYRINDIKGVMVQPGSPP